MDAHTHLAELERRHGELIHRLTEFAADADLADGLGELARAWKLQLELARDAVRRGLRVVFLGPVGCGKSTLVAATTGLRLTDSRTSNPRSWSILPVGGGRITLGDTRIVYEERDDIRLEVDPIPAADLEMELRLLAQDHMADLRDESGAAGGHGEELYALLRAWIAPEEDDEDEDDDDDEEPEDSRQIIKRWAAELGDEDRLFERFIEQVRPGRREQPWTRELPHDDGGRKALRKLLDGLRRGTLGDDAPAPRTTTIRLPVGEWGPDIAEVVDTQGLDTKPTQQLIDGRADLQQWLSDPDALLVVCSKFADAPDDATRALLAAWSEHSERAPSATPVIIDRRELPEGKAEKRAYRRERKEKLGQCRDQLRRADDLPNHHEDPLAIDARSESGDLRDHLAQVAQRARAQRVEEWEQVLLFAVGVFEESRARQADFSADAREMDLRLWWTWDAALSESRRRQEQKARYWPEGKLPADGLVRLGRAITHLVGINHHSHVAAAVRRRGRYRYLDFASLGARLAAAVDVEPYRDALQAVDARAERLGEALADDQLKAHLQLRRRLFANALRRFQERLRIEWAEVLATYLASPRADSLWWDCRPRWGEGPGYLRDVGKRFVQEAESAALRISSRVREAGPVPDLPARPPLLRLRWVRAAHYRGIVAGDIPIGAVTVLAGDNGQSKTGWLEATAAALSALLPALGAGEAARLTVGDVHHVIRETDGIPELLRNLPLEVEVEAELVGRALRWQRTCAALPRELGAGASDISGADGTPLGEGEQAIRPEALPLEEVEGEDGRVRARRLHERLEEGDPVQLPVLAYYGTQRLWPALKANTAPQEIGSRLDGYRRCLDPASTHRFALNWMRRFTFAELQRKQPVVQLRAIQHAVVDCVEDAASFYYDVAFEELRLEMKDGRRLPFHMLSDGYRNIVAMVADIAWRAVVLNPHLGSSAAGLAEGVVLIDEIDLHLHPNWQRRVLADLRRAFPRLQFVTTTHSPFIIQSLEPGQLVNLDPDATDAAYADESPEDIAEHVMGVEVPQRSRRRQREAEVAEQYYTLLDRLPDVDAVELLALRTKLDELLAPHTDNQAFVALLQRKRLVAEAKRG